MKGDSEAVPMPTAPGELARWMVEVAKDPAALEVHANRMTQWLKGEGKPDERDSDSDSSYRCDCAEALGKTALQTQTAIRILVEALTSALGYDANGGDVYGGVWMIYVWEAAQAALCAAQESSLPLLIAALDDPDPVRRERVAVVLGRLGGLAQAAVPTLIRQLADPVPKVRWAVSSALKEICGSDNAALRNLLESRDPEVVYGALTAIEPLPAELVPWCAGLLEHPQVRFRSLAAMKLQTARRAADSASYALVRSLNDPDVDVRRRVIEALGWVGLEDPDAPAALVRTAPLTLPVDGHTSALTALRIRAPRFLHRALLELLTLLEDPAFNDRKVVLETVQKLDLPSEALPALLHLTESVLAEPTTPRGLREPILIWTLGAIAAQGTASTAIPILSQATMDVSESVRHAAAESLRQVTQALNGG